MPKTLQFLDKHSICNEELTRDAERGLLSKPAFLPPKFFYDLLGSKLFDAITHLPEYYLTSTEEEIFSQNLDAICKTMGSDVTLVDLGAGNCKKATRFFKTLKPAKYIAVDISVDYLKEILPSLQTQYPDIAMMGLGMDFSSQLDFPKEISQGKKTFFYPGSSLGNFTSDEAAILLKQIQVHSEGGGLLLGIDLWKDAPTLRLAYEDPLNITAAFNLNILRTVNQLIGSDFDILNFKHCIEINESLQRVELYLEARQDVSISWPSQQRNFKKGERIHTENSHKYTLEKILGMLKTAGFQSQQTWSDANNRYAVIYAN